MQGKTVMPSQLVLSAVTASSAQGYAERHLPMPGIRVTFSERANAESHLGLKACSSRQHSWHAPDLQTSEAVPCASMLAAGTWSSLSTAM